MRPEAADGHDEHEVDQAAIDDFVPWKPGDPSTASEAPRVPPRAERQTEGGWARLFGQSERGTPSDKKTAGQEADKPTTRWWTEDTPQRYNVGDAVRAKESLKGEFGLRHVPAGTRGRVVDKGMGLLSGEYLVVEFENGYTEPLVADSLKRDSWF